MLNEDKLTRRQYWNKAEQASGLQTATLCSIEDNSRCRVLLLVYGRVKPVVLICHRGF